MQSLSSYQWSKRLLISWLQSPSAVILEPRKMKSDIVSTFSPSICHDRRAPGALRPLRSGPRPVAEQSGLLGFYCTFLLEVPVAVSGRCGWTSTQPSTPTALDLGRVSPGPQDCPKTSSTFPSKAGPNLATVDLDGQRKKLFHSFFLFLLCHLLLTDPSILSKPKTRRNFIPLTKTTA